MLIEEDLCYQIRGCVFEVFKLLGAGYLEKVYERALLKELEFRGLDAICQVPFSVRYKDRIVGEYQVDILVENKVILELKAQENLSFAAEAQLINYLKASKKQVGLLINFVWPKATIKRLVL